MIPRIVMKIYFLMKFKLNNLQINKLKKKIIYNNKYN